jgi:hypothetical protein
MSSPRVGTHKKWNDSWVSSDFIFLTAVHVENQCENDISDLNACIFPGCGWWSCISSPDSSSASWQEAGFGCCNPLESFCCRHNSFVYVWPLELILRVFNIDSLDGSFGFDGSQTVTALGNNWNWCSVGIMDCLVMTTCQLGTVLFPGTSYVW